MCISTYAQISSPTEKNNAIIIDNGKKDSVKIFKPTMIINSKQKTLHPKI